MAAVVGWVAPAEERAEKREAGYLVGVGVRARVRVRTRVRSGV
jgi:hypothetical protein